MRFDTPVTRLLGIRLPVIQAGMSWASSNAALPLAVSNAGGLGTLGAGPMRLPDLDRTLRQIAEGTEAPWAVNMPLYRAGADEALDLIARHRPPVLVASQGGPKKYLARFKELGTTCLHVVAGVEHARKAVEAGVDGLVVVGAEAGGHPPPNMVSTLVVVRAVAREFPGLPIVASGGFADGAGLAAALALGAGAANFGTRFMATPEANIHPDYRAAILSAGIADTRTVGRGMGVIRALRNAFTDAMETAEAEGQPLDARRTLFQSATLKMAAFDGDISGGKMEAGQSAGLVDDVRPAAEVVAGIVDGYRAALDALPRPLSD